MRSLALAILVMLAICIALAVAYFNQSAADNAVSLTPSVTLEPPTPSPQFKLEATPTLPETEALATSSPQFKLEATPTLASGVGAEVFATAESQADSLPKLNAAEEPIRLLSLQEVADVRVVDEAGSVTYSSMFWDGTLPGVMSGQSDSQPVQIFLSANRSYDVYFRGTGKPAMLTIILGPDEEYKPNSVIQYHQVMIPEATDAMFSITPYEIANLRYDADYDGVYETMIEPSLSLEDN